MSWRSRDSCNARSMDGMDRSYPDVVLWRLSRRLAGHSTELGRWAAPHFGCQCNGASQFPTVLSARRCRSGCHVRMAMCQESRPTRGGCLRGLGSEGPIHLLRRPRVVQPSRFTCAREAADGPLIRFAPRLRSFYPTTQAARPPAVWLPFYCDASFGDDIAPPVISGWRAQVGAGRCGKRERVARVEI
jgi:hypothetical protein